MAKLRATILLVLFYLCSIVCTFCVLEEGAGLEHRRTFELRGLSFTEGSSETGWRFKKHVRLIKVDGIWDGVSF